MTGLADPPALDVAADDVAEYETRLASALDREAATAIVDRYVDGKRIVWAPQPGSQVEFLACPLFECLYHGTRGPGKTDALLMAFAQYVGKGYGESWRGIIFRETYPQLADVVAKSQRWFRQIFPEARLIQAKPPRWEFETGEVLYLSYMRSPADYWNFHGHEYPFIGWEELTNWADDRCYKSMFACCRSSSPTVPRMIRATTNPYGCVPFGDVLTSARGWVPIQDVLAGESVVSCRQDGMLIDAPVEHVTSKSWGGQMVSREGRGLYMEFTEDHRLPLYSTDRSSFEIRGFNDLPGQACLRRHGDGWLGRSPEFVEHRSSIKCRKISRPVETISVLDYAELLGWYVSEGCCCVRDSAFCIAQMKPDNVQRISELLDRCGFRYRYDGKAFWVSEKRWMDHFSGLGKSREKHIPSWFKLFGQDALQRCLDSLMLGDGCGSIYYTTSRRLADDVAEIATKVGLAVFCSDRQRENRDGLSYQVCMSEGRSTQLHTGNHVYSVDTECASVNVQRRPFSGEVYCLTVPDTETFFIRQNGCVWLSGNTGHNWVKMRFGLHQKWWTTIVTTDAVDLEGRPEPVRAAIHGHINENKILLQADPNYKQTIGASALNKAMAAAWLDGSWELIAGGMFDDVWDSNYNDVPEFVVPKTWRIDRAFDWGSSKPFSVGWYAQSDGSDLAFPDGRVVSTVRGDLFRINEWYGWTGRANEGLRMLAVDVAEGIVERELVWGFRKRGEPTSRVRPGPADSSIFTVENGRSIGIDMEKPVRIEGYVYPGVAWTAADKRPGSRKAGWEEMRMMIRSAHPKKGVPREDPGLFVVGSKCPQFVRTVMALPRDELDLDDVDTDAEDHVGDETRYRVRSAGTLARSGSTVGMY